MQLDVPGNSPEARRLRVGAEGRDEPEGEERPDDVLAHARGPAQPREEDAGAGAPPEEGQRRQRLQGPPLLKHVGLLGEPERAEGSGHCCPTDVEIPRFG